MADEYFYARNQEKRGPFSAAELKNLATTGQLLPTDLVWKRGTPKWLLASSIKGLLPASPLPDAPMPEMPPELPAVNLNTDRAPRPRAPTASVAKRHALTAGKIAALSAERTKIANVNLPLAFTRLGNHCYAQRLHANAFAALFSELDDLSARITATKSEQTLAPAATFVEKAKALADKGLQAATAQKLLLLQKAAFARLGRAAYEQQGSAAGPEDLVGPIASLTARLAEVNQELREKVQSAGGTRKVLTIAGGVATALLVVVGLFLSNRLSLSAITGSANAWKVSGDGGSSRSSKGPTAANSRNKPSRADRSPAYEAGWADGRAAAFNLRGNVHYLRSQQSQLQKNVEFYTRKCAEIGNHPNAHLMRESLEHMQGMYDGFMSVAVEHL